MTERPTPVTPPAPPAEWWRFRMVWLVLAGPAAVVVASLVTAVVAWRHIDPVIGDEPEIARAKEEEARRRQRVDRLGGAVGPVADAGVGTSRRDRRIDGGDGGRAIVGNVTQHARVIVSADKPPAAAARQPPKARRVGQSRDLA